MNKQEMSIIDHISELRRRLIITVFVFLLFLIIGFVYTKEIYAFIVKDLSVKLVVLGPSDIIWVYFAIAAIFSIVCTIPIAAFQLWLFVKPALHANERKMTLFYVPALFLLFIGGLCFGYFVILPIVLSFLTSLGSEMFQSMFTTEKYFHFVMTMTIPFAVLFELPAIAMFLTSIGLLNPVALQKVRRYAYFILIIIAVTITPPDFISDFLVAIPLLFIYELSISLSKMVYKRRMKREEEASLESAL
ncbi:twin-arginine translocase subunit TatC [Microbacteriaceae bacterium 4G12]